jgi:heme A synthase
MFLGISGAIAALGDTLFPARSLSEGLAQDFAGDASIFVRLRWFHPVIAAAVSFAALWFGRRSPLVLALLGAQLMAGALNLIMLAPVWMQMVHLLLAYAFWIALVIHAAEISSTPVAAPLKVSLQTSDTPV